MAKVGLVLEGGGMRGSYTLGILDVLLEEKLYFPYVIGVSAGACNAASYASRQAGRGQRIVERFLPDPRYLSFGNLLRRGHSMFGMDFIFDEIPARYELYDYDTFYALGTRLVIGVTDGFEKKLEVNGVGSRVQKQGTNLVMNLGYSHQVIVPEVPGITIDVPGPNEIVIKGPDKQKVGQFAAEVRSKRPPEPYKGTGIKYAGEHIRRKEGKAGKGAKK